MAQTEDEERDKPAEYVEHAEIAPNWAATAAGTRMLMDNCGVLPYHKAVYGPYKPIDQESRLRADSRLVDVSLAIHTWMPPAAPPEFLLWRCFFFCPWVLILA